MFESIPSADHEYDDGENIRIGPPGTALLHDPMVPRDEMYAGGGVNPGAGAEAPPAPTTAERRRFLAERLRSATAEGMAPHAAAERALAETAAAFPAPPPPGPVDAGAAASGSAAPQRRRLGHRHSFDAASNKWRDDDLNVDSDDDSFWDWVSTDGPDSVASTDIDDDQGGLPFWQGPWKNPRGWTVHYWQNFLWHVHHGRRSRRGRRGPPWTGPSRCWRYKGIGTLNLTMAQCRQPMFPHGNRWDDDDRRSRRQWDDDYDYGDRRRSLLVRACGSRSGRGRPCEAGAESRD